MKKKKYNLTRHLSTCCNKKRIFNVLNGPIFVLPINDTKYINATAFNNVLQVTFYTWQMSIGKRGAEAEVPVQDSCC